MEIKMKANLAITAVIIYSMLLQGQNIFASEGKPSVEIIISAGEILDWRLEDLDNSGEPVLLIIRKREPGKENKIPYDDVYENGIPSPLPGENKEEAGLEFGNDFLICQTPEPMPDLSNPTAVVKLKLLFAMDFTAARPMSVKAGDIDGDGTKEISICMYKTTRFHPVYAKRPFLYRYDPKEKRLAPVWLGSRLSRPFDDYIFVDLEGDGIDELVSIETNRQGESVVTCYYWWDFGFYKLGESSPYENIFSLKASMPLTEAEGERAVIIAEVKAGGIRETVEFIYLENKNPDPSEDYGRLEAIKNTNFSTSQ